MADNEILIKIETAYKSGGIEAVKKAIADTEKETKSLGTATAGLERNTAAASREFNNAQRAASAMNAATSASRGSFIGLAQVFELMGGKFGMIAGKLSLVASAAIVGWKIGIPIFEKLWSVFVDGAAKAYIAVTDVSRAIKGLNDSDLARIRGEISALVAETATVAANMDRAAARREKSRTADTAAKTAELESAITDPALREKAIAALKEGESQNIASDQAKDALAKLLPAERAVKGIDDRIALLKKERAAAKTAIEEMLAMEPTNYTSPDKPQKKPPSILRIHPIGYIAGEISDTLTDDKYTQSAKPGPGMSPLNPERQRRRERYARGETIVAGEIDSLTAQRESAYQTYLDRQTDYQTAAKNVGTTSTTVGTAINTRVAAFDKSAADRSSVVSGLQGAISREDRFSSDSNLAPSGMRIQSGENSAALRRLLSEVQAGNEQLTKDLLELFQSTADNQVLLRAAMERAKSTLTNIPL